MYSTTSGSHRVDLPGRPKSKQRITRMYQTMLVQLFVVILHLAMVVNVPTTMAIVAAAVSTTAVSSTGCATVDVSSTADSLSQTQTMWRAALAKGAPCVSVLLGSRQFVVNHNVNNLPLLLTGEDSNINLIGAGAEFTGAIDVPSSAWVSSTDVQGAVEVDVQMLGVNQSEFGFPTSTQQLSLLVQVRDQWRPMNSARWPNVPFDYVDVPPTNWTGISKAAPTCNATYCNGFVWANDTDRPLRWAQAAEEGRLYLHGFFRYLWRDHYTAISHVDPTTRTLSSNSAMNAGDGVTDGGLWYAYNLKEELDVEGEAVLDHQTGKMLAILPQMCMHGGKVVCLTRLVPAIPTSSDTTALISIDSGAQNVAIQGLNFSGSHGLGISIAEGVNDVTISQCVMDNLLSAVTATQATNVSLIHSEISFTLVGSCFFDGGNRTTLTGANLLVENNRFHDFGTWVYTYSAAVHVSGVGVVVRKNEFSSNYHTALLFAGNNHLFELNEFHHCATIGYDTGVIYGGRDLSSRGTIIRHNLFHHIDHPSPCNAYTSCIRMAIYVDDFMGGVTITGNIFYRCLVGFFSNCGSDFTFSNNLFVNVGLSIRQSGQYTFRYPEVNTLFTSLHAVPFTAPLWTTQYPTLASRFSNWTQPAKDAHGPFNPVGSALPENNLYALNAVINATGPTAWDTSHGWFLQQHIPGGASLGISLWCGPVEPPTGPGPAPPNPNTPNCSIPSPSAKYFAIEATNTAQTMTSIEFVSNDPGGTLDFALAPTSPLYKLGWQTIPESDIGPEMVY
eukprot:m.113965 g.113965  ORF g.113965 m.113965 type:complete len:785 (-) comp28313_c0_seq1:281-2635(-)